MIKLEGVSKYYYSKVSVTQALRNINLQLNLGEFVAITGESGSGKTTLLNIISGLDTYEDGDILINNKSLASFDDYSLEKFRKDNISFIFQNNNLIDSYTVFKNVEAALVIQGLNKKERINKVKEIIEQVGLSSRINNKASKLSGGEKQRLAIARALARKTNIIIADEPTGNLDSETGDEIIKLLRSLSKDKLVLIVTHNYLQIEKYVTRKIRVYNGEIVEDKILAQPNLNYVKEEKPKEISNLTKTLTLSNYNFFSQPQKSIFISLISFVLVFFIFAIYSYTLVLKDPDIKRNHYLNSYQERLVVKRKDNQPLDESDFNFINKSNKIKNIIKEDLIVDMQFTFSKRINSLGLSYAEFRGYFDSSLINSDKKIYGRIPENDNEILISKFIPDRLLDDYLNLLNEEISFMINDYQMSVNHNFKIVGIIQTDKNLDSFYINESSFKELYDIFTNSYIRLRLIDDNIHIPIYIKKDYFLIDDTLSQYDIISTYLFTTAKDFDILILNEKLNIIGADTDLEASYYNIYVSEFLYNKLIPVNQFARDYQYTINLKNKFDYSLVSKNLIKSGYDVYSPFYDNRLELSEVDALNSYLKSIGLQVAMFAIILVLYLFSYFIYNIVLRTKVKDYTIFKVLGANDKLIKKIIYFEFLFSFIIAYALYFSTYPLIKKIYPFLVYYRFKDYCLIIFVNTILALLIVNLYIRSLKRRSLFKNLRGFGV